MAESRFGFRQIGWESHYVRIKGSDLLVPRREAYVAFGGRLIFDVIFVVGFDGVDSPLLDVRYVNRPDKGHSVTPTLIRTIPFDALVKQAISENRTAYRWVSPQKVWAVSSAERQASYLPAMQKFAGESRRRITDKQLERVAEVYLRALADRMNPTQAVEKEMRLPNRNVAKKWVQKSRAAGFLSPAPGERRGGAN